MPNLRGSEWLIIILLIALLFGAKRLPDAARGIGRSLRIFKAETRGLVDGEPAAEAGVSAPGASAAPAPSALPAAQPAAQSATPGAPPIGSAEPGGPALQPQGEVAPSALQQPPAQA